MEVFPEIRGMIGLRQARFHTAEKGVDPSEARHIGTAPARRIYLRHMNCAGLHDSGKTVQAVAEQQGRETQIPPDPMTARLHGKAHDRLEASHLWAALCAQMRIVNSA